MNYHKGFIAPLLLVLIALLLAGGGAYVYVQKNQANQPATATSTTQTSNSQTTVLDKICGQTGEIGASINKCGDFYSSYPGGGSVGGYTSIVSDASTQIYDSKGTSIDFCGGFGLPPSKETEQKCSMYLRNCVQVVKFCSPQTPVR